MQKIIDILIDEYNEIVIEQVMPSDYSDITKGQFFFNWKTEQANSVFKLRILGSEKILGLMSLINYPEESRMEINLLAVSKENRGKNKRYEGIAGNLIAFACREAIRLYGEIACVSLISKTTLKQHYIEKYGMLDGGRQVYLEKIALFTILEKYIDEGREIK